MESNLDVYIRAGKEGDTQTADNAAFAKMMQTARAYKAAGHNGNRLRIHLVLRNRELANTLRNLPVSDELADDIELYTYTNEDIHSMKVLGIEPGATPLLLQERVTYESNRRIHLVIFGTGLQAESLAIHTALAHHLPNYCRNNELRTRITWFADDKEQFHSFFTQYNSLLENSYRRMVYINGDEIEAETFAPVYANERRDFVDVEWEFVTGKSYSEIVQYKLQLWSNDDEQMLTIAFCYDDDGRNQNEAIALPEEIKKKEHIIVRSSNSTAIDYLRQSKRYANIIPFGNEDDEISGLDRYVKMAQYINFAYCSMRDTPDEDAGGITVATQVPTQESVQLLWNDNRLNTAKRWSNIYNAFALNIKMHLLGIPPERWDTLFAISERDIEQFTEVEHNRWSLEELILGYRPATKEQHNEIVKDPGIRETLKADFIHDDLRHFSELGVDSTGLPVSRYDKGLTRTLPLIAYIYHTKKDNRQ